MGEATEEQIAQAVYPELAAAEHVSVGGKKIEIKPFKRRWQALFRQAALPFFRPEITATEEIQKAFADGTADFKSIGGLLVDSELESDAALDRAAAIVLAAQIAGAEMRVEETIAEQTAWLGGAATTEEMRELVERQAERERLIESVGERLPARLVRSARLAGDPTMTVDSIKRRLTSLSQKSQE